MTITDRWLGGTGQPRWAERSPNMPDTMFASTMVTFGRIPSPGWLGDVEGRLKELLMLPDGWDGAVADPISYEAVDAALNFVHSLTSQLATLRSPTVTPTVNSGVAVMWHEPDAVLEFEFDEDGSPTVYSRLGKDSWEGAPNELPTSAIEEVLLRFVD